MGPQTVGDGLLRVLVLQPRGCRAVLRGPSNAAFHLLLSALDTPEMALLTRSLVGERLA